MQLPEIVLGPIKYDIGEVYQVLRSETTYGVIGEDEVQISPRVKERCVTLENGERVIITARKNVDRPSDVDGVLYENEDERHWQSHKLLDDTQTRINEHGLAHISKNAVSSWHEAVRYKAEKSPIMNDSDKGLRPPQLGALFSVGSHWSLSSAAATIVMPTGTGKTETMLAVQAAHQIERLVVAVPSKALRSQIADKFMRYGMLRALNVLKDDAVNPVVGIIKRRPKTSEELAIFQDCNVCVGVVSSLSGGTATNYLPEMADIVSALMVDEAHHIGAASWRDLKAAFQQRLVLQFTATPFRNDGKLVDGSVIYSYPLKTAQDEGYFKRIDFSPVYELDEDKSDQTIAEASVEKLRENLAEGYDHLMMARCQSVERAEAVFKIYEALAPDLNPLLIHSDIQDADERVAQLRSGQAKIAVCVNMLGEGIDVPELKIAAIHDMHQSLAVLLQFIGRFTRTGSSNLGDATVVANIGNPKISTALENLYSEDANWNELLREMSSDAAKEHAEFIRFLENSTSFHEEDDDEIGVSEQTLKPIFSTMFYKASEFRPRKFYEGLSSRFDVRRVWLNEETNTLYFVTRSTERIKWASTKEIAQVEWDLFVLHHDSTNELLYLASTNKGGSFDALAKAVGATDQLFGEEMFRSLGGIGRLVFNNLGVTKHGRRNLSFAMYTGADVKQALSETEKQGSRKSNVSGYGWEDGRQITIGCSYKGRVWSKAAGTIPAFIRWAEGVGAKIVDDTIDTKSVIANVLIPEYVAQLPGCEALSIDWPVELYAIAEDRVSLVSAGRELELFTIEIRLEEIDRDNSIITFSIITEDADDAVVTYDLKIQGEAGFSVTTKQGDDPLLRRGNQECQLSDFFNDYPPLVRFVDLSEVDGNIILKSENAGTVELEPARLEPWDWDGVDIKKESYWKNGEERLDSIQWRAANNYIEGGFPIVFDDDGAGEAADLVCIKEEDDFIQLSLVHCKFSGAAEAGQRVKDVVEVASQTVRSARWPGRFKELVRHLELRNKRNAARDSLFLNGSIQELRTIAKSARFKEVRPNIVIVQPGVSKSNITQSQSVVLGAASSFIKQTLGIDIDVICSD